MSLHSETFWFRANQYLHFLLNAACVAVKQQIQFCSRWIVRTGARKPTIYHTRDEHANNYTTDAVPWRQENVSIRSDVSSDLGQLAL